MSHQLLKTQRNRVFEILQGVGLSPSDFLWGEQPPTYGDGMTSAVIYLPDPNFFFHFDFLDGKRHSTFSPGSVRTHTLVDSGDWDFQQGIVKVWATALKAEITEVDLWDALKQVPALASVPPAAGDDAPINEEERVQLREALTSMKKLAAKEIRDPKQIAAISAIADRTEAQSWKVSRRDLWLMFVGNVMATVMSGVLTVDTAKWLFAHLQGALTWLVLAAHSQVMSLP